MFSHFKKKSSINLEWLLISASITLILNILVFYKKFSWIYIGLLLISLVALVATSLSKKKLKSFCTSINKKTFLLNSFFILLPIAIRLWKMFMPRYHLDEYISAHISANYQLLTDNFFGAFPTDKAQWVCQFPSIYFFLQKIFFNIFGSTLLTVKLSVLPYVSLIAVFLFLILKNIFNTWTARIGMVLYSFLAISLYFESWGLHFMASTAFYLICLYQMVLHLQKRIKNLNKAAILLGVSTAFCYFFYASSYIVLPIVIGFYILLSWQRKKIIYQPLILMLISFSLVMSPFLIQMRKTKNYYLFKRYQQVKLVDGEWSGEKRSFFKAFSTIQENLSQASQSFIKNDIGGGGGYDFANLAIFDKFTFILLLSGFIIFSFLLKNKILALFIQGQLIGLFFLSMVLTIPPPAYHRFTLALPLIIINLSCIFYFIKKELPHQALKTISSLLILVIFIFLNLNHFAQATTPEIEDKKIIELTEKVKKIQAGKKLYVAAFPGYAFAKFHFFANNGQNLEIKTDYHDNMLKNFDKNEDYLYVVAMPETFIKKFKAKDPQAKIIEHSTDHYLFYN